MTTCRAGSNGPRKDSGFPARLGAAFGLLNKGELTARIASSQIGETLDRLGLEFDPGYDTTEAFTARLADKNAGKKVTTRTEMPFDVVLATSMLQVGVDVQRLGLMLVVGQPKNTAEYIQASSRVGRDPARPGLVVALGNWARPRDLAHFEQFRHYHETFYAQVEALSVTPYSPTSLERGIDGLLISTARVMQGNLADGLSQERSAWRIKDQRSASRGGLRAAQETHPGRRTARRAGQTGQRSARQSARPVGRTRPARRGDEQDAGLRAHR